MDTRITRQFPRRRQSGREGTNVTLWVSAAKTYGSNTRMVLWMDVTLSSAQARIRIKLTDQFGQEYDLYNQLMQAGSHALNMDVSKYGAGSLYRNLLFTIPGGIQPGGAAA